MVPDRMVHELEVPLADAGLEVHRDERFAKQIVAGALAAIEITTPAWDRCPAQEVSSPRVV